ncbi:nuclear speckle splicing regulatory protein 1 isoform X1 [Mirounga leonina]|uniref:nuclear speckle splicing regulatory protein 1 isoform X1 n=1 Tax=Mirounga leonina TaxID=9715 RepID=UPI00156C2FE2|nr:nuclear speckle splicing regulatory protein 1 isoform X1 [Mirounga leonina]XP_045745500.1 nuclear speckle splicing regulatory protein 1 isoform X3 [Mirounga angustirostris]
MYYFLTFKYNGVISISKKKKCRYGLILPKKAQQLHPVLQKPSVFGNDSDDDDETSVSESLQREAAKKQAMKQTKLEIQKALAEDSTVYEYDSIYDEMQKKKEENNPKLILGKDRKPKYIHNLLKAVEIRKKEQEKRMEKKIQREREMEKGEFDDKEAFVTSAYKKKLQERAEEEEREKRAAALEARLDVTKQKDLSGFYRHLLNQAVGEEEVPTCSFREARSGIKEEKSRGYSDEVSSENRIPHEKCSLQTVVQAEENPDADSDFYANSEDDEMEENNKVNCRRKKVTETSESDSKHQRNQAHSRSSSEEREHGTKCHTKRSKSGVHEKREDQHQERQSRDHENYYTDRGSRKEKKDSQRHREVSHRASHWKRHEHEDKLRGRDQRERNDRDWKREKDREKYSPREQERDRPRNDHDRHNEKGGEKEEKSKEKEEHMKARKERYENSDKYRDREREISVQSSERSRDKKESSPNSRAKDRFLDRERSNKMRNTEKDKERNPEKPSSSETSLGAKHILTEGCQEMGKEQERPHEVGNKFAKRSNEETVMSARDRYLARQMARVNAKTYIEKEDD